MTSFPFRPLSLAAVALPLLAALPAGAADNVAGPAVSQTPAVAETDKKESPWLFSPVVSADPKLGTSIGAMGGYLYKFDPASPTSTVGLMGTWSDTDSTVGAVFARLYFDGDRQRLNLFSMRGEVFNSYKDFLGTGYPLDTTDVIDVTVGRYLFRTLPNLYLGVQAIDSDYAVLGDTDTAQGALDFLGLNGFSSTGVGAALQWDTRDNQNSPRTGSSLVLNNVAYREDFGGAVDFDVYNLTMKHFIPQDGGGVLALFFDGRWTDDAPRSGYSSVRLRGYTVGQYLAPHAVWFEGEERIPLKGRVGAQFFAGATCLYGGPQDCGTTDSWYPAGGAGLNYMIKPEEKMVIRLDVAVGRDDNRALYLDFGQAF